MGRDFNHSYEDSDDDELDSGVGHEYNDYRQSFKKSGQFSDDEESEFDPAEESEPEVTREFITIMKNLMMNLLMEMITSTTSTSGNRSKDLDTFQKTNQNQSLATILTQVGRPIMTLEEQGSERNLNLKNGGPESTKSRVIRGSSLPNNGVNLNLMKNIYLMKILILKICIITGEYLFDYMNVMFS